MHHYYTSPDGLTEIFYSPIRKAYVQLNEDSTTTLLTPDQLPDFIKDHMLTTIDPADARNYDSQAQNLIPFDHLGTAHAVTSVLNDHDIHRPVLDIDFPVHVIPSSTPGHFHLYLDKTYSSDNYFALLQDLAKHRIIEKGFANSSAARGFSAVRLPWISKDEPKTGYTEPWPGIANEENGKGKGGKF